MARVPFLGSLQVGILLGARSSWHPITILEKLLAGSAILRAEGILDPVTPAVFGVGDGAFQAVVGVGEGAGDGTGSSSAPSS